MDFPIPVNLEIETQIVSGLKNEYSWLGDSAEVVDNNLYSLETKLANTEFAGWTPSTTGTTLISPVGAKQLAVTDMDEHEYWVLWECGCDLVYQDGTTDKAKPLFTRAFFTENICKRPSSWASIESEEFNGNVWSSVFANSFMRYFNSTGTVGYLYDATSGFYFAASAAVFNPATGNTTITFRTPAFNARCHNLHMSTANCSLIDQDKSTVYIKGKLIRTKRDGVIRGSYNALIDMINGTVN